MDAGPDGDRLCRRRRGGACHRAGAHLGQPWAAAGDGIHCFDPDGTLLGKLRLPEPAANLVFGGLKRNRLFVTASTSLYSLLLNVTGAR